MNRIFSKRLAVTAAATLLACSAFAVTPDGGDSMGARRAATPAVKYDVPLVNWAAPQFFNPEPGIHSSMPGLYSSGITTKAALTLSTFIPITPCRLVDTRGLFSPVYAGGAFAAGETRVYRAPGNCGVPAGANRVRAVSLAVTTPPTAASGDIEVVSESQALGGTVVMVIQASQWNSATTVSGTDGDGDFKVQLRGTSGHVVIDINGYYASVNTVNNDYISIVGSYALGGGLLFVDNSSPNGAAINAVGSASSALLGYGPDAIVLNGGIRVNGAGVDTNTAVFIQRINNATNSCIISGFPRTVLDHPDLNGNPDAIPIVGQGIFAYPGGTSGASEFGGVELVYYVGADTCGTTPTLNKWQIIKASGTSAFPNNHAFPVMVIKP